MKRLSIRSATEPPTVMENERYARRQRRRLAEMCRAKLPVPPASPFPPKSATSTFTTTTLFRRRSTRRCSKRSRSRRAHGTEAGRRREPAAGQRPLRRQVLHAGHDGHHPQPRPQRPDRQDAGSQEQQSAVRPRLLPPLHPNVRHVVLEVPKADFDTVFARQKKKAKAKLDTELTAEDLKQVIVGYKKLVEKKDRKPSRRMR